MRTIYPNDLLFTWLHHAHTNKTATNKKYDKWKT